MHIFYILHMKNVYLREVRNDQQLIGHSTKAWFPGPLSSVLIVSTVFPAL